VSWLDDDLNTTLDSSIANVNSIELLRERERGGGGQVEVLLYHCSDFRKKTTFLEGSYPTPVCPSDKIII